MIVVPRERREGKWKQNLPLHVMLFFPVILTILYKYVPMLGIVIAFKNYKPGMSFIGAKWVGMQNFRVLFMMPGFIDALRNTVTIAVVKIVLGIIIPVTFSLMLNDLRNVRVRRSVQTIIYMPHFISWVLMAGIIQRLLSPTGLVNQIVTSFGGTAQVFLAQKELFRPLIYITHVWKEFGYGTIVYLAAICSIDNSLYEAAMVDGAGAWQKLWHVTLPGIVPTIILMTVLALGNILNAGFDQIFNLYSPIVYKTGDIIDTFVYRMAFNQAQFSMSTAAGLFKSVISSVLIITSYRIAYRTSGYRVF